MAPEQVAPEGAGARSAARGSCSRPRGTSTSEMVSRVILPSGWRMTRSQLQVEGGEGRRWRSPAPWSSSPTSASRMATGELMSRRPCGGERRDQLEMLGDRVEPAPDQRDLRIDDARRRDRPAAARRCRWRRPAPRCRRCPRSARAKRRPAPAPRSAAGARAGRGVAAAATGASGSVLKPGHHMACRRPDAKARRGRRQSLSRRCQAAARIAALLTLPSTWPSNCWKLASKRWATSRAALS